MKDCKTIYKNVQIRIRYNQTSKEQKKKDRKYIDPYWTKNTLVFNNKELLGGSSKLSLLKKSSFCRKTVLSLIKYHYNRDLKNKVV